MGLKIVREFMFEMNGEIDLKSSPNGTEFILTIPFKVPLVGNLWSEQ